MSGSICGAVELGRYVRQRSAAVAAIGVIATSAPTILPNIHTRGGGLERKYRVEETLGRIGRRARGCAVAVCERMLVR